MQPKKATGNKANEESIPEERHGTIRREILTALEGRRLSAREISTEVRIAEKDVYDHLEHIRKTADTRELHFVITPAECRKCGFVFRKRERLRKPGRCPVCKGEAIRDPLFSIGRMGGRETV